MRKPTAEEFESFSFSMMLAGLGSLFLLGLSYVIYTLLGA